MFKGGMLDNVMVEGAIPRDAALHPRGHPMDFRVLIIEDDPASAALIQEMLLGNNGASFNTDQVPRLSQGLQLLRSESFDLVLLDLSLPDSEGYETFETVRSLVPHIAILILTGHDDRQLGLKAVRHGAQDYLLKDQVSETLLRRSIHYAIERKRLEQSLQSRNAQLRALHKVGVQITRELDLDDLLRDITRHAVALSGCSAGILGLYRADQDAVVFAESVGLDTRPEHTVFGRGEGLTGKILETEESALIRDYADWNESDPAWVPAVGHSAVLGTPVVSGDRFLGVLHMLAPSAEIFTPYTVKLLEAFSVQAAIAIRNAQFHQALLTRTDWLEDRVEARTEAIRAQQAEVEAILESIQDGIIVMDSCGTTLRTNSVMADWFHHTLTPEDARRLKQEVRNLARIPNREEGVLLELQGRDLELVATPIEDGGVKRAVVVLIHDVTHLRAVDRLRSRFVSNISHELRTPLSSIRLCIRLIREQPDRIDHHLEIMEREANYEIELIEKVMELSQLDAGGLDMDLKPESLSDLVRVSLANHQFVADAQGVTLHYRPVSLDLDIMADEHFVLQALNNFMDNGIKYTEAGGSLCVTTERRTTSERCWATVTFKDTGIGIPECELPHIFDRFFRGDRPSSEAFDGYGLGLAMAKEIVELHGGRITVSSEVNKGSTFTVWLPLLEPSVQG